MPHKIQCPWRKYSLHLPAHIYLSPVNVCGAATVWPFAALRLIPLLMHLLCLHCPPLATHQLLLVFVAIGLLSTSIHLCLRGRDVNPKWLIKGKSTPKSNTYVTLHTLPIILHGCHVKYCVCRDAKKSCSFCGAWARKCKYNVLTLMQFRKLKAIYFNIVFHIILKHLISICFT